MKYLNVLFTLILFVNLSWSGYGQVIRNQMYDVTAGNGYGVRFWESDHYKIHMGNSSDYKYGAVTDYSIKMNMNNDPARGWTWGVAWTTPVASINTEGH